MSTLYGSLKVTRGVLSGTATLAYFSVALDRASGGELAFIVGKRSTATTVTATVTLQEGDTSSPTGAVAAGDIEGDTAMSAAIHSGKIVYIGKKRYVRAKVTMSAATGGVAIFAVQTPKKAAAASV